MPTRRELIMGTENTPATDILVPLQQGEENLTPLPKIEYDVIMHYKLDKLIKDVNTRLEQWRQTEWWIQVSNGASIMYYQTLIRWNVDSDEKPEMPSQNSEAGNVGPKPLNIPELEDEPDLYEDVWKDETEN